MLVDWLISELNHISVRAISTPHILDNIHFKSYFLECLFLDNSSSEQGCITREEFIPSDNNHHDIYMYIWYIHICMHIHICIYLYIHIHRVISTEGSKGVYIYIYVSTCIYIYMYTYICIYIFIGFFPRKGLKGWMRGL
jgi:hypothetical protein